MIYLHRANFLEERNDMIGPFDFAQITYNTLIRVPEDHEIAHFANGLWQFDDNTEWTDVTITAETTNA